MADDRLEHGEGRRFTLSNNLFRVSRTQPYVRRRDDPLHRPLQIYTLDPAVSRFAGAKATIDVPFEPLAPGPVSTLLEVIDDDGHRGRRNAAIDLEDIRVLTQGGRTPSATDCLFHQQMVYAVAMKTYTAFRNALGRDLNWGFDREGDEPVRLRILPHWNWMRNAYYDKAAGELRFGYYKADQQVAGRNLPGGTVYTCLSHDIVAHEMTHALLDGLRPYFIQPTHCDVLALHEAFGDLVAIFQHFSYQDVLAASIEQSRGKLTEANLLADLARQFGHTIGKQGPLRSAIDVPDESDDQPHEPAELRVEGRRVYDASLEPHALGTVLVSALFDAFNQIYTRKTRDLIRLATGGTGVLPPGDLPMILQRLLAREASSLAAQFLKICVRAIDYCPPVDVTFGDFLRALITADFNLVADDPWGYREALIDAFRMRRIYPSDVDTLAEEALLWRPPESPTDESGLRGVRDLQFRVDDPDCFTDRVKLRREAAALGRLVTGTAHCEIFGIADPRDPRLNGDRTELPQIESMRASQRVGPDGQLEVDLVAEVVQRRWIRMSGGREYPFYGGATIIFGPSGDIRYAISKNVLASRRVREQLGFLRTPQAQKLWRLDHGRWQPVRQPFRLLHE